VQATIAFSGQPAIGLAAPVQTVANAQQGLKVKMLGTTLQQCGTSALNSGSPAGITLTEGFPGAFKQPTWVQGTGGGTLANWIANGATAESGFIPLASSGIPVSFAAVENNTFTVQIQNAPTGVIVTAPSILNLVDPKSNVVGSASSNVIISVSGLFQSFALLVNVTSVTPTTTLKSVTIPITFSGTAPSLPVTFSAVAGFSASSTPQNTLYEPTFAAAETLPIFGTLDTGIATPPENTAQSVATVYDCTQTTLSLGTGGQALPVFQITGPITPRVYNVPLLSNGPAVLNLQILQDLSANWLNASLSSTSTPASILLSVNPATANLQTTLQIVTTEPVGSIALPVTLKYTPGPWFTRYGFTNSASYVAQAVAPGEPFLLGGYNFGNSTESNLTLGSNGFVTTTLGGAQVMFDNIAAPLQYVVQINGVGYIAGYVPFELANQGTTNVQLIYNGTASPPVTLNVIDAVPAIFTANTTGGGQGAILNSDFSVNGQGNGASPGQLVYIYGGGAGQTTPPGRTGGVTGVGAPVAALNLPVSVFIDGVQITDVPYAGPAPDLIEGVFQVNVRIPANARTGTNLPVVIQVGDKVTQPGVTVYVK
jgi:uncharacterized protein (TIGR03437 family)